LDGLEAWKQATEVSTPKDVRDPARWAHREKGRRRRQSRRGMPGEETEKPEEREIQEGRGAGVFSPSTHVTALEAGSKPLKSTAIELARVRPQDRWPNDRRGNVPEKIRNGSAARDKPLKEKP